MYYIKTGDYYKTWGEKGYPCPFFLLDFNDICLEMCGNWLNYYKELKDKQQKVLTKPSYVNKVEKESTIYIEFCQEVLHSSTAHHVLAGPHKYYYKPEQRIWIIDSIENSTLENYYQDKITWIKEYKDREK